MSQATDLKAVIFDMDGTLVETERHGHRVAFNRAFESAGLPDRWDEELYGELLSVAGGRERILHYLTEKCANPPADPARLAAQLHKSKVAEYKAMVQSGELDVRPGILRLLDELHREGVAAAVATTGTRSTVVDLLMGLGAGGPDRFAAVLTADEAPRKKPDPQVYEMALIKLGITPHAAVAVEDSRNGLLAARAAGIPCLVTVSDYNAGEDFDEADLVVENLGEPDTPAEVLFDPHGVVPGDSVVVDACVLRSLHQSRIRAGDSTGNP